MDVKSQLLDLGLTQPQAEALSITLEQYLQQYNDAECWQRLTAEVLSPDLPDSVHQLFYKVVYALRDAHLNPGPAWMPSAESISQTHIAKARK